MRTLYDAVTWQNIPRDAPMVAGYVDGYYAWPQEAWDAFPAAVKVRIAVHQWTNDGHVLDVEPGDAAPNDAPAWVQMRRAAGLAQPTVYCSLASWAAVRQAFIAQGIAEPEYWIAAYPGNGPNLYDGAVAHQYEGDSDQGWDRSVVADFWPGVDGAPTPPTPPTPTPSTLEDDMALAGEINYRVDSVSFPRIPYAIDAAGNLHFYYPRPNVGDGFDKVTVAGPDAGGASQEKRPVAAVVRVDSGPGDPPHLLVEFRDGLLGRAWIDPGTGSRWNSGVFSS